MQPYLNCVRAMWTYPTRVKLGSPATTVESERGPRARSGPTSSKIHEEKNELYQGAGGGTVARGVISHFGLAVGKSAPGLLFTQPSASWADLRVL